MRAYIDDKEMMEELKKQFSNVARSFLADEAKLKVMIEEAIDRKLDTPRLLQIISSVVEKVVKDALVVKAGYYETVLKTSILAATIKQAQDTIKEQIKVDISIKPVKSE